MKKRTPPPKKNIIADLVACKAAFAAVRIPWVLVDGLVLGYLRHRDVTPGDTDLDFAVCKELSPSEWQLLFSSLRGFGFRFKNLQTDFVYGGRTVKFNFWMYHKKGSFYEVFPKSTPGVKFVEKAKWYDKIQLVNFLGDFYPVPTHIEDYVACRYGADWKEVSYTHHDWRKEKYGTYGAGFERDVWLKSRCGPKGDLWPRIMKVGDKA